MIEDPTDELISVLDGLGRDIDGRGEFAMRSRFCLELVGSHGRQDSKWLDSRTRDAGDVSPAKMSSWLEAARDGDAGIVNDVPCGQRHDCEPCGTWYAEKTDPKPKCLTSVVKIRCEWPSGQCESKPQELG